jgi:hypothetical protein
MQDIARQLAQAFIDNGLGRCSDDELYRLRLLMSDARKRDINKHQDTPREVKRK